jgi:MFS family permease
VAQVGWVFTIFFIFLGSAAALLGKPLERLGPRVSGLIAAFCWGGGYMIASYAVRVRPPGVVRGWYRDQG